MIPVHQISERHVFVCRGFRDLLQDIQMLDNFDEGKSKKSELVDLFWPVKKISEKRHKKKMNAC